MINLKSYSAKTHHGPHLEINEDDVFVDLINKLYLVFDGFGGAGVGDKMVQKIKDSMKLFYTRASRDPNSTMPFYFSNKYLLEGNALINSLHFAHSVVNKENLEREMSNRGGSSVIAVAQSESLLTVVSTGNCLGLLYSGGTLDVLINPDSLQFLSDDHFTGQYSTMPLSGIGLFQDLHLNCREIKVSPGDQVLLLTDGVYSRIAYKELRHIFGIKEKSLGEKIDELFTMANHRGNMDNQTSLFLQF